jgi:hypothetical protein
VEEISTRHLKEQLGEKISNKAGADFEGPMKPVHPTKKDARAAKPDDDERSAKSRPETRRPDERNRPHSDPRPRRDDDRKKHSRGEKPRHKDSRKASRWHKGAAESSRDTPPRSGPRHTMRRPFKGGRKK